MNRYRYPWIRPTILVIALGAAALVLGQPAPNAVDVGVMATDSGRVAAPPVATVGPTAALVSASPRATPRGKEIYKGHTLEEVRADPSLLAEVDSLSDYIRPIHREPVPPLRDTGSDAICPTRVECP